MSEEIKYEPSQEVKDCQEKFRIAAEKHEAVKIAIKETFGV